MGPPKPRTIPASKKREAALAAKNLRLEQGTPKACRETASLSRVRRRLFCARYGACLDYAVAKQWPNFHCDDCLDFVDATPTALDMCVWDMSQCQSLLSQCLKACKK